MSMDELFVDPTKIAACGLTETFMIIDCHGHFTTVPKSFRDFRAAQVAAADIRRMRLHCPPPCFDDQIREGVGNGQLKLQQERGYDLTLFSPSPA
jgi:4-oxalmesaconate hydratase